MSLHTARKKIDELTIDELERELECAHKLFRDINWRYEYNRRTKQFKQDHPNASEIDLLCQYAKEAHHIATILNATGEDYIDAVKLLIKLKKSSDKE
jgi:hypothetical protein